MSYLQGMGLDLEGAVTAIDAVSKVVEDPALPEVACNVLRLHEATKGKTPRQCARHRYSAAQKREGVSLYTTVTPLRVAVWARQNPALAIAAGAGIVGGLVGLGYLLGRSGRR